MCSQPPQKISCAILEKLISWFYNLHVHVKDLKQLETILIKKVKIWEIDQPDNKDQYKVTITKTG